MGLFSWICPCCNKNIVNTSYHPLHNSEVTVYDKNGVEICTGWYGGYGKILDKPYFYAWDQEQFKVKDLYNIFGDDDYDKKVYIYHKSCKFTGEASKNDPHQGESDGDDEPLINSPPEWWINKNRHIYGVD